MGALANCGASGDVGDQATEWWHGTPNLNARVADVGGPASRGEVASRYSQSAVDGDETPADAIEAIIKVYREEAKALATFPPDRASELANQVISGVRSAIEALPWAATERWSG